MQKSPGFRGPSHILGPRVIEFRLNWRCWRHICARLCGLFPACRKNIRKRGDGREGRSSLDPPRQFRSRGQFVPTSLGHHFYKQSDCLSFGAQKRLLSRKRHLPLKSMACEPCRFDCLEEVTLAPIGGCGSVTSRVTFRVTRLNPAAARSSSSTKASTL
jgi:hypothetical protein